MLTSARYTVKNARPGKGCPGSLTSLP